MKKLITLLAIVSFCQFVSSQISNIIPTSTSIAQTSVADSYHWTSFSNPAMLGYVQKAEFGLQYENRYLISELSTKSVQLGLPSNLVNVGLSFSHFGYS